MSSFILAKDVLLVITTLSSLYCCNTMHVSVKVAAQDLPMNICTQNSS